MSQCSPPRLRITGQCGKIGSNGGTDILSQYQCSPQFKANPAVSTHDKRNCHRCCRCLYNHSQNSTDKHKQQNRNISHIGIALHKGQHFRICFQIRRIGLQHGKSHKEERETENKFTDRLTMTFLREEKRNTEGQ